MEHWDAPPIDATRRLTAQSSGAACSLQLPASVGAVPAKDTDTDALVVDGSGGRYKLPALAGSYGPEAELVVDGSDGRYNLPGQCVPAKDTDTLVVDLACPGRCAIPAYVPEQGADALVVDLVQDGRQIQRTGCQ